MKKLPALSGSLAVLCCLLAAPTVWAQAGDREGHDMADPPADLAVPPAPPLTPAQAMAGFVIEEGFEVQLVASEPLVEDPVCMAWDADGRLWVCEMLGYMPDLDATGEDQPTGNIVILEDTDNDGVMDRRTVFLDQIVLPRAIAFTKGGVLYADATTLYFVGIYPDGTAGHRIPIDTTYSNGGPSESNVEHQANGLLYGLDNWYYSAKSKRRYRYFASRGNIYQRPTEFRGQWGITQDDAGNLLANGNSTFIEYELFPPNATLRNPNFSESFKREVVRVDNAVYPIRVTPGVNRGYQPSVVDHETWKLKIATAASGPVIYRGTQFPQAYYNNVFIPEPAGHLLKRVVLGTDAEGRPTARQAYEGREFLASTDERCRFVNTYVGPDGCLYVIDMYRGLIQHRSYVTTFLRKQVEARGLEKPLGMGRIYRVVHKDKPVDHTPPALSGQTSEELVALLGHANAWQRETAQRLLVQRGDAGSVRPLERLAVGSDNALARIHALWTLDGIGKLKPAVLETAGQSEDPRVWVQVMRLAEQYEGTGDALRFVALMRRYNESPSWPVDLQLAFSAGVLAGLDTPEAYDVLLAVLERRGDERLFRHAMISGLRGKEAVMRSKIVSGPILEELSEALVKATENGELTIGSLLALIDAEAEPDRRAVLLADVASQAVQQDRDEVVLQLVERMAEPDTTDAVRRAILQGMAEGRSKRTNPMELDGKPALFEQWSNDPPDAIAELFAQLDGVFVFEKTVIGDEMAAKIQRGAVVYSARCVSCHGEKGESRFSQGPPLAGSDWVEQGSPRMLAALVLHGVAGDIVVSGKLYTTPEIQPSMAGLKAEMTDAEIADVLTYIRNSFGNRASEVDAEVVAETRAATALRDRPYSPAQLIAIQAGDSDGEDAPFIAIAAGPIGEIQTPAWLDRVMLGLILTLVGVLAAMLIILVVTIFGGGDTKKTDAAH